MPRLLARTLIALCGLWFGVVTTAQSEQSAEIFGDWSLNCGAASCVLSQSLHADDDTWLLTVVLPSNGQKAQFFVPAGVHLGSGFFVEHSKGASREATWINCSSDLCRADLDVSESDLAIWRRDLVFDVVFRPRSDASPLRFPVSLKGITAGLRRAHDVTGKPT